MTFLAPLWLWALLGLPLLVVAELWIAARDRDRLGRFVDRPLQARVVRRPAEGWRRARLVLVVLGAAGIIVALARPQWGVVREKVEREGVDVVILLDTSGSMATEDVAPNRFFLARAALSSLVARLEGDRFALVAFEGEAYPLVPLTLDADAVGLFLETIEPGIVPGPGTSLGLGLSKGLELFVDRDRRNKVMVLVSDGEDLEGEVEAAVAKAKEAGVVVHTVGIGSDAGAPVPAFDKSGNRAGFKKDEGGSAVISRLHPETLEAIARGTGGRFFRIGPAETSLSALAAAIEGMEQKSMAREFSYRGKEWFQVPLATGLGLIALGLLLPLPAFRRRRKPAAAAAAALLLLLVGASTASAQMPGGTPPPLSTRIPIPTGSTAPAPSPAPGMPGAVGAESAAAPPPPIQIVPRTGAGRVVDEMLLRPRRAAKRGAKEFELGQHPASLESFRDAASSRPGDPRAKFDLADAMYKNGRYEEAEQLFRALGGDAKSPLAPSARFNLGNTLYQKQDFPGAIRAYRDALRLAPEDGDTKRNLELALRALEQQQKEQQQQKQDQNQKQEQKQEQQKQQQQRPKTEQEKEQERYQKETGMPKDRAMQLLDALQRNEKEEQKKLLAAKASPKKKAKDW